MSGNGKTITYKYNDSGIRTQKTVNGVITTYHLVGDKVTFETNGTDNIYYTYDSDDNLVSMNLNGVEYYYIRNNHGDIIGLHDSTGAEVVSYTYDSWGKLISTTGPLASSVGVKNPYRYRGYRYDTETSLYYLQSRYYNAETCRMLNADAILNSGHELLGHNVFAYVANNPVNYSDPSGYLITPANVVGALIGAGAGYLIGTAIANYFNLKGWKRNLAIGGSTGLLGIIGWFSGPAIYAAIKPVIQSAVATGTIKIQQISAEVAKFLRLVNDKSIKFASKAAQHMNESGRYVPIKTLTAAIKYGRQASDPRGSRAMMYYIDMYRNGKKYQLEVLYDWASRTIYHFQYYPKK